MNHFLKRIALVGIALCMASGTVVAQLAPNPTAAPKLLSDTEVKAKYQNCEGGWYSGPRPGKARYAKDPFLWVVTPEFAKRFCMPPEFVSTDLKGAEAVAFRIVKKPDDEYCGFGGNAEACAIPVALRFEVYIKRDVKLPKAHEGRRYEGINLPSSKLISKTPAERKLTGEIARRDTSSAWLPHFPGQQVGLVGVKDGKVAWPIVSLNEEAHFGGVFGDIDYYSFEGSTGFFENPGIKQNNVTRFFIDFQRPDRDKSKPLTGQPLSEMAHYIELPEAFTNQVAEADRTRGTNMKALLKDAFGPATGPAAPVAPGKP